MVAPTVPSAPADTRTNNARRGRSGATSTSSDSSEVSQKHAAAPVVSTGTPANPALAAPGAVPMSVEPAAESRRGSTVSRPGPESSVSLPGSEGPFFAAALQALAAIAGQYGSGAPTVDTGRPPGPPSGPPEGPVLWDGAAWGQYQALQHNTSRQADALRNLNVELGQLLGGAATTTTQGRAAIGSIVAEVNTALTALGPVANTAAGRQLLISTLDNALRQAGTVLGGGQLAAAVTADQVERLADRYRRESRDSPSPRRRALGADSGRRADGPPRTRPSGQQGQWIGEALRVLAAHGYDISRIDPADIAAIIQHESGGNPHAINLWDSNAAAGIPSKGLMQTIDPTFNAHSLPGHRDIWNPVDNIIAGVRYSIDRYGSVSNVPGIVQLRGGGGYVGY
ncbi:hypothetical protein GCM10023319_73340 [Nocardia iowensis]